MSRYQETYARWKQDPAGFWAEAAQGVDWVTPWTDVYAQVDGLDRCLAELMG
jgi:propionyl-CoA synthetase